MRPSPIHPSLLAVCPAMSLIPSIAQIIERCIVKASP
jgi:hypothetical protein